MRKSRRAAVFAFLIGSAVPALADDMTIVNNDVFDSPAYMISPVWMGLYAGGQLGWTQGKQARKVPAQPRIIEPRDGPSYDEEIYPPCEGGDFIKAFAQAGNSMAEAWMDSCQAGAGAWASNTGANATISDPYPEEFEFEPRQPDTEGLMIETGGQHHSLIGGIHVGYNHQFRNNFVLGAVTDLNFLNWDRYVEAYFLDSRMRIQQSLNHLGTVRAKFGYAIDRALIYGTGGLAYGSIKNRMIVDDETELSDTKARFGYAAGVGAEFLALDNLSIGAEYLFTDLGKDSNNNTAFDKSIGFHSIFVKASYHFK